MKTLFKNANCYCRAIKKRFLNLGLFFVRKKMLGNPPRDLIFIEPNYYIINNLGNSATIFDIGTGDDANFSQDMIAKFDLKSFGFDPTRKHYESLRKIAADSKGKFIFNNFAVSNELTEAEFSESKNNVSGSFSSDHVNIKRDEISKYLVKVVTLDYIFETLNILRANLIKIDVEGEEYKVINSLSKLTAEKIDQLIVEFHHHCIDKYSSFDTYRSIMKMKKLGFSHYSIDGINYLFYKEPTRLPQSRAVSDGVLKISFGIIVLNGEPFTKYCLRSIYKFAYEIIIVEGATENAKELSTHDGHSIDGTIDSINDFIRQEDIENKIKLVSRQGYWKEKNEQSEAYATLATGDYLWQIDIDEFYCEDDMEKVVKLLKEDPSITAASFKMLSFWGGINYISESPIFPEIHRVFKYGPGYRYVNHRPPTVINNEGVNLRQIHRIDGNKMASQFGVYMYHYCLVFPLQIRQKVKYYTNIYVKEKQNDFQKWATNNFFRLGDPFHVHDTFWRISWLKRFKGKQPRQILKMMEDISNKKISVELRPNDDIELLLSSWKYLLATYALNLYYGLFSKIKSYSKKILSLLEFKKNN